jgi:hypothetical protein
MLDAESTTDDLKKLVTDYTASSKLPWLATEASAGWWFEAELMVDIL